MNSFFTEVYFVGVGRGVFLISTKYHNLMQYTLAMVLGKFPPGKFSPGKFSPVYSPRKNSPPENSPQPASARISEP